MFLSLFFIFCANTEKKRHVFFIEVLICVIALETGDGGGWAERRGACVCESVCVFNTFQKV